MDWVRAVVAATGAVDRQDLGGGVGVEGDRDGHATATMLKLSAAQAVGTAEAGEYALMALLGQDPSTAAAFRGTAVSLVASATQAIRMSLLGQGFEAACATPRALDALAIGKARHRAIIKSSKVRTTRRMPCCIVSQRNWTTHSSARRPDGRKVAPAIDDGLLRGNIVVMSRYGSFQDVRMTALVAFLGR